MGLIESRSHPPNKTNPKQTKPNNADDARGASGQLGRLTAD
jgi:hypothetical protein